MKKIKKINSGITLIALIITIIVLLILAGVSINALVGENGIISQSMNARFLNEITEVQEAFDLWKSLNGEESLPTNGFAKTTDIVGNGRIAGEIAYFRMWQLTGEKPAVLLNVSENDFNNIYSAELNYIPRGIEDLYYLDTDEIGLKTDKKYVVDASNGLVYSITGYNYNSISLHSLAMYKMVVNSENYTPRFKNAEVASTGDGTIAAGNVGPEYFTDDFGNYVDANGNPVSTKEEAKNPNYNPYGFRIITSNFSNCVYKLYNNGDLYGKGEKGPQLSTASSELAALDSNKFCEFEVPLEIGEYKKVVVGFENIWVIDKNDDLWAWGANDSNIMGLNESQKIEFNSRTPFKINVDGKKVSDLWVDRGEAFVLTSDNNLYTAGSNSYYKLGIGDTRYTDSFQKVNFPNPENIDYILASISNDGWTIIRKKDGTYYACGNRSQRIGRFNKRIFCTYF